MAWVSIVMKPVSFSGSETLEERTGVPRRQCPKTHEKNAYYAFILFEKWSWGREWRSCIMNDTVTLGILEFMFKFETEDYNIKMGSRFCRSGKGSTFE